MLNKNEDMLNKIREDILNLKINELIEELKSNNIEVILNKIALYVNVTVNNVDEVEDILSKYEFEIVDEICDEFDGFKKGGYDKHYYIVNVYNREVLTVREIKKLFRSSYDCYDVVKNCFYVSLNYLNDCKNYDMGVEDMLIGNKLNKVRRILNIDCRHEIDIIDEYIKFEVRDKIVNYY